MIRRSVLEELHSPSLIPRSDIVDAQSLLIARCSALSVLARGS